MATDANHPPAQSPSGATPAPRTPHVQILGGSLTLLASSGLASITNLGYNIMTARMLGPAGYGNVSVVTTLLMLLSAITLAFQIVCAKLVANHDSPSDKAGIYSWLHRRAWTVGITIGLLLILFRSALSVYLRLPDEFLIVLLACGTAFYIPLGVRRGYMQGNCTFASLAYNFVLEGITRLGGAWLLITMGRGVTGVVAANAVAIILACVFASPNIPSEASHRAVRASFREGLQAIVFFTGQVIINNFDIALVKHFFSTKEAGVYAAVALVGRLINMCTWSVGNTMFPLSARRPPSEENESTALLKTSLLLVGLILTLLILGLSIVPSFLWKITYGAQFEVTGVGTISSLMTLYAVTSGIYSLSSVIIAYEMSRKIANTAWVQLALSGVLVAGIYMFHSSLRQVIVVQLVLMLFLLCAALAPFLFFNLIRQEKHLQALNIPGNVRCIRSLTQDEVIAEFLKNEFHHRDFNNYRQIFLQAVAHPNFSDREENALRRALLFLRRGSMWRELPADTEWFEVKLTIQDLERVRVFPRGQWRRVAQGGLSLNDTVNQLRTERIKLSDIEFASKLERLRFLVQANLINPSVLLIGNGENSPLTILDGNHRFAAAMLIDPTVAIERLRFICGFSPNMTECCWYRTNVSTLWRYVRNLMRYMTHDPESDLDRFLPNRTAA